MFIVLLGLALSASIWWLYFGAGDDSAAERALERLHGTQRAIAALLAYFFAYLPMLLGLVLVAAAEHAALEHPFEPTSWRYAATLAVGASLILSGRSLFRRALHFGHVAPGLLLAVIALATLPLGAAIAPAAQIAALIAVIVVTVLDDRTPANHRETSVT